MATPAGPLEGDALLSAVTEAIAALHHRYYDRAPGSAKSRMLDDDLLVCVLGDVYTNVEKTLIELQSGGLVTDSRGAFQHAMEDRFIAVVEQLTGRRVIQFISRHHIGPDLEIGLFFFDVP